MKKPVKVLIVILVITISLTVIIGLGFNIFSRQLGDFYVSRQDYREAIKWYVREYDFYHSEDSLVSLCNSLIMANQHDLNDMEAKYLGFLIENQPTQMTDKVYGIYFVEYLVVLYQTNQIEKFKEEFELRYKLFIEQDDYLSILAPFKEIQLDEKASSELLIWSNEMLEKIILVYDHDDIKRFGYRLESMFYQRLGDNVKSLEFEQKSDQFK